MKTIISFILTLMFANLAMAQLSESEGLNKDAPSIVYTDDSLLIGGQPSYEELKFLASKGLQTVINIRQDGESIAVEEEKAWTKQLGLNYIRLPLSGRDINVENSQRLARLLEGKKNVLVHCASANRIGALFAIDAFIKADGKMSVDKALEFGKKRGLKSLEPRVKEILSEREK